MFSGRPHAFAEYTISTATGLTQKPASVSHAVSAAAATPAVTALQSLRDLGRLPSRGRTLIIGASGGVGALWSATRHLLDKGGVYVTTLPGPAIVFHLGLSLFTATRAKMVMVKNRNLPPHSHMALPRI